VLSAICHLVYPAASTAHDLGLVRIDIEHLPQSRLALTVKTPPGSTAVSLASESCTVLSASDGRRGLQQQWQLTCPDPGGAVLRIGGVEEGAFLTTALDSDRQGTFVDSREGVVILRPYTGSKADGYSTARYLVFGFEHILSGWDHLLFVLMLCLLARGWRLVKLVTAFTVGHSVTLALAVLGLVAVAGPAIEACIALSIVFLARQVLVPTGGFAHGYLVVTAFGMLHGLGFAGALVEAGIPPDRLAWALLAFNLGVEAGQLVFVALALLLFLLLNRLGPGRGLHTTLAWLAGVMGCYWTLIRVLSM